VIDTIIKNLEMIHDFYPYVEIASNPPKEPANYFKAFNFTKELEDLKVALSQSDRVASKVLRQVMRVVKGLRDGHFGLNLVSAEDPKYENVLSSLYFKFPFEWNVETNKAERKVTIFDPDSRFLSAEACAKIRS